MWKLRPDELLQLKGAGGERFAHFVDRLIRAEAALGGLSQSEVRTQLRVNIKDGGVNTEVTQAIPHDRSGWFSVPTCWQFKAVEAVDINDKKNKKKKNSLQEEINKSYAGTLINQGYGFRFCLLGDLTPQKLTDWEEQLKVEARRVRSDAVDPRVVHGGHLLAWAERFPAVVSSLRNSDQEGLHWEAWEKNCRAVTKIYVPNPGWKEARDQILLLADFNLSPGGDPCLLIGGAAGVGKTRLVFETLNESLASPCLVVYARDGQEARRLATTVANTPDQSAILVADECTFETYSFLNENIRGHIDRIRVICLDNSGPRLSFNLWLDSDSIRNNIYEILRENFPDVPDDRRRRYADFSRGFVRLAADMCDRDIELADGRVSGLLGSVEKYLRKRLGAEHLPLISFLALFHKVGFQGDVRTDVEVLSSIANCTRQDFINAVRVVKEAPGFVVQAGRYWYVTPEIVARALFLEGWRRWVESDLSAFFTPLPARLVQQLVERVATFGGEEARNQLASFFRGWVGRLTTGDLADSHTTSIASAIIESSPQEYLSKLHHLIESAGTGDLVNIRGDWNGSAWGPRRSLIALLEKLVAFPDFFENCEDCLFRLALHENEPNVGNNATEIWRNLYCVRLSGTAAPFDQRIGILRDRLLSPNLDEMRLAFRGLDRVFAGSAGHIVGPPEVAGRLRPGDWRPASISEEHQCYLDALNLYGEHLTHSDPDRRSLAVDGLVGHMTLILSNGLLDELKRVLALSTLEESDLRRLVNTVERIPGVRRADRARSRERPSHPVY